MKKIAMLILIIVVFMLNACGNQETETVEPEIMAEPETETVEPETVETIQQDATDEFDETVEVVQKYTVDDSEAADLVAYFGKLGKLEEIPTYSDYLMSQARAYVSDFGGTEYYYSHNDSRRLFFTTEIEEVVAEYESCGEIYEMTLEVEVIDTELYRVNPYFRIYYCEENVKEVPHEFVTFRIKTVAGETYYMTWVPPEEEEE